MWLKRKMFFVCLISILILIVGCSSQSSTSIEEKQTAANQNSSEQTNSEWSPEGTLEFIASYSPGGGHDIMLRTMAKILMEEKIVDNTINVVNKPGGSGAVGMAYTSGKDGESNYIMAVTSSFLTTPLQGDIDMSYEDFTPIARLGLDPYLLVVRADSGINTFEDFVNIATKEELLFGGTSVGSGEHMLSLEINEAINGRLSYLPFEGDGEVVTALLGGHIDAMANNINSALEYIENGDMIPLAISTSERVERLPDVPTFKELGYDLEWVLFRGVYGPPNMPQEAQKWFENKMKELSEHERWKEEYLDKYMIEEGYLNGEEFKKYLDSMNAIYEENLRKLGIIK